MATHRTSRLKIYGDGAEVTKLINSRYRISVRCYPNGTVEDWFYANIGNTFASFNTQMDEEILVSSASKGWTIPAGQKFPNAKLISMEMKYSQTGEYIVEFIYETLTSTWVSSEGDVAGSTESGLRTIQRTQVAQSGTASTYDEDDIGVSTITSAGKTLYLAKFNYLSDDRMAKLESMWMEAGVLKQTTDTRKAGMIVLTTETVFGPQAFTAAPASSDVVVDQISEYQGIQTKTRVWASADATAGDISAGVLSQDTSDNFKGAAVGQQVIVSESLSATAPNSGTHRLISTQIRQNDGYVSYVYTEVLEASQVTVSQTDRGFPFCNEISSSGYGTVSDPSGVQVTSGTVMDVRGSVLTRKNSMNFAAGEIATWKQLVTVQQAGTVTATTYATPAITLEDAGYASPTFNGATSGTYNAGNGVTLALTDLSDAISVPAGTIAYAQVVPASTKKILANVSYRVTTTPAPSTSTLAYDFASVSCCATYFKNRIYWTSGVARASPSVRSQPFPGHYISGDASSEGEVSDSLIFGKSITNVELNGATSAPGTTGLLSYSCRVLFTAIDGTLYYEEVEVTV